MNEGCLTSLCMRCWFSEARSISVQSGSATMTGVYRTVIVFRNVKKKSTSAAAIYMISTTPYSCVEHTLNIMCSLTHCAAYVWVDDVDAGLHPLNVGAEE